ncbi:MULTISPECIES: hypothetical protein [Agrobacterium]|uniref:hypothetical protein n=1 Tax=Agrobacterium TaxID=357 RepID=UPI00115D63B4|nr:MULTISPECIES: hypothetical protein [Agrobacterium]
MKNCDWEEISSFRSLSEYQRFLAWLEEQVKRGECEEIVEDKTIFFEPAERKFRCRESGQIWRLLCPDPGYFSGSWRPEVIGTER